jgi:hypothetical protein
MIIIFITSLPRVDLGDMLQPRTSLCRVSAKSSHFCLVKDKLRWDYKAQQSGSVVFYVAHNCTITFSFYLNSLYVSVLTAVILLSSHLHIVQGSQT